jgi:hypothetical protein
MNGRFAKITTSGRHARRRADYSLQTPLEEAFLGTQITTFLSVIFKLLTPFLPSERLPWAQRLRLSIRNAEEVLQRDRGMEMQKGKSATIN